MGGDVLHFQLLRKHFRKENRTRIALDFGANQGFYTYYAATLGYDEVHSIEMNPRVFRSLLHGQLFNERGNHVVLHQAGVSDSIQTMSMRGDGYGGFLTNEGGTKIQAVPMDCFVAANLPREKWQHIDFVKIDTEGFEIAALEGGHVTTARYANIILMEVGPDRWSRSGKSLEQGIQELQRLPHEYAYIFLRGDKQCPTSLRPQNATTIEVTNRHGAKIEAHHILSNGDWRELITMMFEAHADCNFWFSHYRLEELVPS